MENQKIKEKKDIVLVAQYYKDNGWYGERYRVILSKESGVGFTTKTEARKYISKLKKRGLNVSNSGKPVILCDERSEFKDYIYCGSGPSLSYTHINITVNEVIEAAEKYDKKKECNKMYR